MKQSDLNSSIITACQKLVPLLPNTQRMENNRGQKIGKPKKGRGPGRSKIRGYYAAKQPRVTTRIVNKNPPTFVDQAKPRHLRSCARCRKHKTKCDYVDTVPNPCSSCARRGVTCELEIVIPIKRSNIIKNISDDINGLKDMVDSLLARDAYLRDMCQRSNIAVSGLVDLKCKADRNIYNKDTTLFGKKGSVTKEILTPPDSVKSFRMSDSCSCSNDMGINSYSVGRTNSMESTIRGQVTPPSDNEYKSLVNKSEKYQIKGVCSYGMLEIERFFYIFNEKLLPRIPIMSAITSAKTLYSNNKLLFWSIIYVVSGDKKIEHDYLRGELARRCWLHTPRDLSIIQSIIIMSAFPIRRIEQVKPSYEFDTYIFQQLELAKDLSAQIGLGRSVIFSKEFSRSIENREIKDKYIYNTWCMLYILGTIYGFKLGLEWDFRRDYIIENMRKTKSYVGRLLNIVILHSEIIETIAFNYEAPSKYHENTTYLERKLDNWSEMLQRYKSQETDINILVMLSVVELTLRLCDNGASVQEKIEQNKRSIELCNDTYNLISVINIATAPIFVKMALEFVSVVLIKLSLSPLQFAGAQYKVFRLCFPEACRPK
ncbi:hypothetical protein HII12_001392 [Brettanomyces bruxellensis]|uniref:Zn(2)-C6 fungal-type domain-containing protein n=1 Tax=Dekkera bruxellensis TaxID=5007 RepID=A0A8H6BMY7_DEKBR|nr:hypothetical protein HII12_001392 [Brettanomyces bruxellensis]